MDKIRLAYQLLFSSGAILFVTSIFGEEWLVFPKILMIAAVSFLYIVKSKNLNYLVLLALLLILIIEILYLKDFRGNFRLINILASIYYCLNMIVLWKSLQKVRIQFKRVFTLQLMITMCLIIYIVYSVSDMISSSVNEDTVYYLNVFIVLFILFIGFCYYIYLNSKTVVSSSLMIAASCFLIVNITAVLNKLYVYLDIFVVIGSVLQFCGHYFLIKFFIEQEDLKPDNVEFF